MYSSHFIVLEICDATGTHYLERKGGWTPSVFEMWLCCCSGILLLVWNTYEQDS